MNPFGRTLSLLWLCAILLTACAAPSAQPPAAPQVRHVRIQYPPELRPLLPPLRACLQSLPTLSPQMTERALTLLEPESADLTLWWGEAPPQAAFALLLGYDTLRVAASPRSGAAGLDALQVAALYRGAAPPEGESASGAPFQVWTYPAGHPFRLQFEAALLDGASTTTLARLAPHPQAMRAALEAGPQAIGILPGLWLSGTLQTLPADLPPQPVLALAPQEPQGAVRNLFACLQASPPPALTPALP